jgi:integrase
MDSPAIQEWQAQLANRAEATKLRYLQFFREFCQFLKVTSDELLQQRINDALNPNLKIQRRIETLFLGFINKKKQEGYSASTQQFLFAAIRSFFECHYYPLKMRKNDYPQGDCIGAKRATKEAILKLFTDKTMKNWAMYRAIIHALNDTGLRVGDLRSLNCKFFLDALKANPNTDIIELKIITQKTKLLATTFFGEESLEHGEAKRSNG